MTEWEVVVLELVAVGLSRRGIPTELFISSNTVKLLCDGQDLADAPVRKRAEHDPPWPGAQEQDRIAGRGGRQGTGAGR